MRSPRVISAFLLCAGAVLAFSSLPDDPSQWSGTDVFQILNNSPWAKTVKLNFDKGSSGSLGSQNPGGGSNTNTSQTPVGVGGMGRRGMGGRSGGTRGGGGGSSSKEPKSQPTEVTIQWQSALVVRMAAAKKESGATDVSSFKPLDDYVIALIGLPITAVGGRAASADSDTTLNGDEEQRIEERVKSSASLLRSGHAALTPSKVELDQGKDGRMLIHFSKADPIQAGEKSVEFRLDTGGSKIQKKFSLKDMEYKGRLEI